MSSLVCAGVRSVAGKITRSGLDTRTSRPPASMKASSERAMAAGGCLLDDDHVEQPRPVDSLAALELDVRGWRRAGDEGDRPQWIQRGQRLGDRGDDLLGADEADVTVGDERERPPA